MPIRDLTEQEISRLLTQAEVNALPAGTKVWIKWSGGNGPHEYEIGKADNGSTWVKNIFTGKLDHLIDFVGKEPCNTRVFLDL